MENLKKISESKWKEFYQLCFKTAEIPEVKQEDLEVGTYTNQQIAEHFRKEPEKLVAVLMQLPKDANPGSKRSILSFLIEM